MDDKFLFFRKYSSLSNYTAYVFDLEGNQLRYFEEYTYDSIMYHNGAIRLVEKGDSTAKYIKP